eukprot:gb/GECH01007723.1/.p1 GENE.gb/GECH01007723.1/~~gb/GECH01007723.1/.p1  ORF type:complete len:117 (+),score=26.64 gb/GECH01007723.1/:1-351(+)
MSFGKIISIMNTKNNALNFNDSKSNDQNHINLKKRSISNVDPKEQQQRSHRVQSSTPSKNSRTRRNQIRSPQNVKLQKPSIHKQFIIIKETLLLHHHHHLLTPPVFHLLIPHLLFH